MSTTESPTPTRRKTARMWPWFAVALVCLLLATVVLHGPIAGIVALGCFVTFWIGCMRGLRGRQTDGVERAGLFLGG